MVNNPSAFLAVKQKSGFVQWSAEENSTGATWGMQGAPREKVNPRIVLLPHGICDPFLCSEKVYFSIGKFHPSQNSLSFPKTI